MTLATPQKSKIQDDLGGAYINTITTHSGFIFKETMRHDFGIDGQICALQENVYPYGSEYSESDFLLKFQLKSIYDYEIRDNQVIYDLPIKNYHELIIDNTVNKVILILVLFYNDQVDDWVQHPIILDYDTRLKYCAVWGSLAGLEQVSNTSSKRIKIPCGNIFNKKSLTEIMCKLEKGDSLGNNVFI